MAFNPKTTGRITTYITLNLEERLAQIREMNPGLTKSVQGETALAMYADRAEQQMRTRKTRRRK